VAETVHEQVGSAHQEAVDQHEVGADLQPGSRVDAPGCRKQVELDGEDILERQAEHEDRDADAQQRDDRHRPVGPALRMTGGVSAQRDADARREDHRRDGQLDGRREADQELTQDRLVIDDARAEVAAQHVAQVVQVLLPERVVETEVLAHRGDTLRRRMLAQDRGGGIAGEQVDEGEQDDRQSEQDGDDSEQASNDEPHHLSGPA
jgi:hypothetical protein